MSEVLVDYLVSQYANDLQKELYVRGVPAEKTKAVLGESEAHLRDMFEERKPETAESYKNLMGQFGSAKSLAKEIAKERERSAASRKFWWPALVTFILAEILLHRGKPGPGSIAYSVATVIFGIGALLVLGFVARKPSVGQFGALLVLMILGGSAYAGFTGYPIGNLTASGVVGPPYMILNLQEVPGFVKRSQDVIAKRQLIINQIGVGGDFYASGKAETLVPSFLKANGGYLSPDAMGRLEVGGVPSPMDTVSNFEDAKKTWTDGFTAKRVADQLNDEMNWSKSSLRYLTWVRNQTFGTQVRMDVLALTLVNVTYCFQALLLTNVGWLIWLLVRFLVRSVRRWRASQTIFGIGAKRVTDV
ncbi:MAG TPA: hypothetical protein VGL56_16645 [Fimbriimonadaceae bacterium]|jgi:hypothetical protein